LLGLVLTRSQDSPYCPFWNTRAWSSSTTPSTRRALLRIRRPPSLATFWYVCVTKKLVPKPNNVTVIGWFVLVCHAVWSRCKLGVPLSFRSIDDSWTDNDGLGGGCVRKHACFPNISSAHVGCRTWCGSGLALRSPNPARKGRRGSCPCAHVHELHVSV
jgi:hypothetical protein